MSFCQDDDPDIPKYADQWLSRRCRRCNWVAYGYLQMRNPWFSVPDVPGWLKRRDQPILTRVTAAVQNPCLRIAPDDLPAAKAGPTGTRHGLDSVP